LQEQFQRGLKFHGPRYLNDSVLASELEMTNSYVKFTQKDKFAGVKYGGVSQDVKNLLYFCDRGLIILGGEESLRGYGGFGGDNTQFSVPMKIQIDALVEKLKERQVKVAAELNLDEVDSPLDEEHSSAMKGLIDFLKHSADKPDDDDEDRINRS